MARDKARRVQNNEAVMWQGIRTSGGGSTVNRLNTTQDDISHASVGDRQAARSNQITAQSAQRSPRARDVHMPIISGSQNTNMRGPYSKQNNEPRLSEAHYRTIDTDRETEGQSNKRGSRKQLKTIDYSDISIGMLKAQ